MFYYRATKPLDFSECNGDELPYGWEQVYDPQVGVYYTNHILRKLMFYIHYVTLCITV